MARPKKEEKKVQYTIMIEKRIIEELKRLAEKADMATGTFVRKLLLIGLDRKK